MKSPEMDAGGRPPESIHGRGAAGNPANRFTALSIESDADCIDPEDPFPPGPKTFYLEDTSRSIISSNDSPDVGFTASINPYRGCEHGCIYCYARPTHEYLGFSPGLDFETRILVKPSAPELLRAELMARSWKPQVLAMSGVTDPYQPIERRLQLSRRCLEVLAEFRNPVAIITKSFLVSRDIDVLEKLAGFQAAAVFLSVTTLQADLARTLEPRTSHPERRLEAIRRLAQAGVPVGVLVAPVIPGLTDHELPGIIEAAVQAGARHAGYVLLRLPGAVAGLFEDWLERNAPGRKNKVLHRLRDLRGGKLNDPRFHSRMRGEGIFADQISALFRIACQKAGILGRSPELSAASFRRPGQLEQLTLFDA